ncbi:hypothetical protein SUGI_0050570 [Cryptomeria japonica]|nr:hypothetical protein SUGI_0050570 [Cryptomeria japonica]
MQISACHLGGVTWTSKGENTGKSKAGLSMDGRIREDREGITIGHVDSKKEPQQWVPPPQRISSPFALKGQPNHKPTPGSPDPLQPVRLTPRAGGHPF